MSSDNDGIDLDRLQELARLRVVLSVPGMQDVDVRRNIPYRANSPGELSIDVYQPARADRPLPAVVFVAGYSDRIGLELMGLRLKEWGAYLSWGELVAASGLVGITYSCEEPVLDARAVLDFVRNRFEEFHVDPARVGIWAASGNGPTALSLLMDGPTGLRFAVMSNTYMLDLESDTTVADMAAQFGFAAPNSGRTVADLDPDVPLFIVRSGDDEIPGLNQTIDRFVAHAAGTRLQIESVNLPGAPHSFDTLHDTEQSREMIEKMLAFMLARSAKIDGSFAGL